MARCECVADLEQSLAQSSKLADLLELAKECSKQEASARPVAVRARVSVTAFFP
jgi:hypothetical protein